MKMRCSWCGKEIESDWRGRAFNDCEIVFCSADCEVEFIEEREYRRALRNEIGDFPLLIEIYEELKKIKELLKSLNETVVKTK